MQPREILNKLKWTDRPSLEKVKIWYVHRGAPDDTNIIMGAEIQELEHFYFVVNFNGKETHIPYHRIKKITLEETTIFQRK